MEGDLIYGNDIARWKQLAQSLRLRIALELADRDEDTARRVIASLWNSRNSVIDSNDAKIPSRSMMDTTVPGDRVVTSKLTPKIFDLQRGDVVVFKDPNNWLNEEQSSAPGGGYLIKRLIGLPGDVVECKGAGQPVTINGVAINETSYIRPGVDPSAFPFSVTVTEGRVFVMGDNRANSADYRYHQDDGDRGLVPISDVVGVGIAKYWPLDRLGAIDDHHEVFKDVPDASGSNS